MKRFVFRVQVGLSRRIRLILVTHTAKIKSKISIKKTLFSLSKNTVEKNEKKASNCKAFCAGYLVTWILQLQNSSEPQRFSNSCDFLHLLELKVNCFHVHKERLLQLNARLSSWPFSTIQVLFECFSCRSSTW